VGARGLHGRGCRPGVLTRRKGAGVPGSGTPEALKRVARGAKQPRVGVGKGHLPRQGLQHPKLRTPPGCVFQIDAPFPGCVLRTTRGYRLTSLRDEHQGKLPPGLPHDLTRDGSRGCVGLPRWEGVSSCGRWLGGRAVCGWWWWPCGCPPPCIVRWRPLGGSGPTAVLPNMVRPAAQATHRSPMDRTRVRYA
jgi:hypothetical protein